MNLDDFIEELQRIKTEHGGHIKVVFMQRPEQEAPDCECCHYTGFASGKAALVEVDTVRSEIPEPCAGMNTRKVVIR